MVQRRAHMNQRRFVDNEKAVVEAVWNLDCERVHILRIELLDIDIVKQFAARIFDNDNFNTFSFLCDERQNRIGEIRINDILLVLVLLIPSNLRLNWRNVSDDPLRQRETGRFLSRAFTAISDRRKKSMNTKSAMTRFQVTCAQTWKNTWMNLNFSAFCFFKKIRTT